MCRWILLLESESKHDDEAKMPYLKINGQTKHFPDDELPVTVAELLSRLGVDSATIIAEVDGQIIGRKNFSNAALSDGQNVELVRIVAGG